MTTFREQAKTSIPRALTNTLGRTNTLDAAREKFEHEQLNAVTKALSVVECPVKEKHVRTIIIGTFKQKTSQTFWNLVSGKAPVHGNPLVCWKFLHVLHKLVREGHESCVREAHRHVGLLEDLGRLWGHLREGYGLLIAHYCRLLVRKLRFHEHNPAFPGSLAVNKETLVKIGQGDAGNFYELCIELLDYMDEILNLEKGVFSSLDMSKANSMTSAGQCRLAPLIACIQDSVHLYDYTVKILFLLHQHLPPDTLAGHTSRFLAQFVRLRKFYYNSSNLQYFKHLVQVPQLPDSPPNFLIEAELSAHVTPVVVVPDPPPEEPEPESIVDERDRYIDELLSELEQLQLRASHLEEQLAAESAARKAAEERLAQRAGVEQGLRAELLTANNQVVALTQMVRQAQQLAHSAAEDRNKNTEEKFTKLKEVYQKLREEHINLLRQKAEVEKQLNSSNVSKNEALQAKEVLEVKVEDMLTQIATTKEMLAKSSNNQDTQIHNLQASLTLSQNKLTDTENELRQKEESLLTLEQQLHQRDSAILDLKLKIGDAEQNKFNSDKEVNELTSELRALRTSSGEQAGDIERLQQESGRQTEELRRKDELIEQNKEQIDEMLKSTIKSAIMGLDQVGNLEDIETVTSSSCSLSHASNILQELLHGGWPHNREPEQVRVISLLGHNSGLVWLLGRGTASACRDLDAGSRLSGAADKLQDQVSAVLNQMFDDRQSAEAGMAALLPLLNELLNEANAVSGLGKEQDLADLVAAEIKAMDSAIEEAARKIEELAAASRAKDSGKKLEVNERILEACTKLLQAIRELVFKSKFLQQEILAERGKAHSEKEFYRKNSRWTEGLISAAKAVGLGAKILVEAADKVVLGSGRFEEIMAASQEVAASTAQLVIASRVKAKEGSSKYSQLRSAAKVVTEATGGVVAVAKSCSTDIEEEELDFSGMSAHQTKTLEMESQVKLLKLESDVEAERRRLSTIRKQNYKGCTDEQG